MSDEPRNAFITGATGAIGAGIADACAAAGYRLHLVCRTFAATAATSYPDQTTVYACDLSSDSEVAGLSDELATIGSAALLVHAAGAFDNGTLEEIPPERLDAMYRVNLRSPYAITRALLPALRADHGQIVFVNSSAGAVDGRARIAAYAATKHALRALADAVRADENASGVRVLSIYPGRTAGPMQERLHALEGRRYVPDSLLQPADVAQAVLAALAQPMTAEVTDIHIRPAQAPLT